MLNLSFIEHVKGLGSSLVTPCITPRFVPTCTEELMTELGKLAKEYDLPIQSHIAENHGEIEWVASLHPNHESYSHVYDSYNLMTSKTIMAHCIYLSESERALFKQKKVGIAHCASSNFCLHSGVLNVRELIEEGHEKVGLGTDCAGGYSTSILDAMRQSIIASKVVHIGKKESKPLNFAEVFYLATLGGAKCMDLDEKIGNFKVGKEFDAIVVNVGKHFGSKLQTEDEHLPSPLINQFDHDDHLTIFEKFIYLGDDRHFERIYVKGQRVL